LGSRQNSLFWIYTSLLIFSCPVYELSYAFGLTGCQMAFAFTDLPVFLLFFSQFTLKLPTITTQFIAKTKV